MSKGVDAIRSEEDLAAYVERVGACNLFKNTSGGAPRIWDLVDETDATRRRGLVLGWAEEAHLKKRLFLFVDAAGSPLLISWRKFEELQVAASRAARLRRRQIPQEAGYRAAVPRAHYDILARQLLQLDRHSCNHARND